VTPAFAAKTQTSMMMKNPKKKRAGDLSVVHIEWAAI
jgi:hypothetical protein